MLWVAEHGKIFRGTKNRCLENGDLELGAADFDSCLSLLESTDDGDADFEPVMSYSRPYGREQLKVANHVGVIRTDSGAQIEILPKISKRTEVESARALLIKMLIELEESPFLAGTMADLAAHRMPLFEILMALFLQQTAAIVRQGIARDYIEHEDNLIFIRGKLGMSEHIRRNSVLGDRVWCRFDEYEVNRPINRLIRGALDVVARLTRDSQNMQLCRELLFWFDQVPPTLSPGEDFRRVRKDRLIRHYEPAMPLCRLILERLNPLTEQGHSRALAVLFPMEKVFEDYVAAKLPAQLREWRVSTQVSGKALVDSHNGRKIFGLIPDLALRRDNQMVIADTKWKLLDRADRGRKYNISQADIYQLFRVRQEVPSRPGALRGVPGLSHDGYVPGSAAAVLVCAGKGGSLGASLRSRERYFSA
jgi:5-methylcytosine-specific restriction enzyme subunit McrC